MRAVNVEVGSSDCSDLSGLADSGCSIRHSVRYLRLILLSATAMPWPAFQPAMAQTTTYTIPDGASLVGAGSATPDQGAIFDLEGPTATLPSQLTVPSSLTIMGEPGSEILVTWPGYFDVVSPTTDLTLSNVTITGARNAGGNTLGGVINGANASVLTIRIAGSVTFSDNKVTSAGGASGGGAIYAGYTGSGDVSIVNSDQAASDSVTFSGNTATVEPSVSGGGGGGAIRAPGSVSIGTEDSPIPSVTFTDNEATNYFGGGIYANRVTIYSDEIKLLRNTSGSSGGAISGSQGGITLDGNTITVSDNSVKGFGGALQANGDIIISGDDITFERNTAGAVGGAIQAGGSGDILIEGGSVTFRYNTAGDGGAIQGSWEIAIRADEIELSDNKASWAGGAIVAYESDSDVLIDGNKITLSRNRAEFEGGAIRAEGTTSIGNSESIVVITDNESAQDVGGAIAGIGGVYWPPPNSDVLIEGSEISLSDNMAALDGGAIYSGGVTAITGGGIDIERNITTAGNGGAIYAGDGFTLIAGGPTTITGNMAGGQGGAIYLNGGDLVLNAHGGDITFSGNMENTTATAQANAIYFNNAGGDTAATFAVGAGHAITFLDPIESNGANGIVSVTKTGPGTVSFDGAANLSNIYAQTTVQEGTFEVAHGAVYGVNAEGTSFTVSRGATLQGGVEGTVAANEFMLQSGATLNIAGNAQAGSPFSVFTLATSSDSAIFEPGSLVKFNTFLGGDGSPSDLLIINGGRAAGNSSVVVTNTNGPGALTTGNGIRLVEAINGATTEPGTFTLAAPAVAGPYEYTLHRGGVTASVENDWFLRSELCGGGGGGNGNGDNGNGGGGNGGNGGGCDPDIPNYRQEVSLDTAILPVASIYGRQIIGTLHERVGEQEQLRGRTDLREDETFNGAWGRLIGEWGHNDGGSLGVYGAGGPEFDYGFGAMQAGMDFYAKEHENGSRDHAGLYFAIGHGEIDVTHNRAGRTSFDAGSANFDAKTIGGYWTHFGENNWYLDGVVQGTWYDVTTESQRNTLIGFPDQNVSGFGFAASLEGGYPFYFEDGWQLEPQAQLVYQNISMDSFNDGAADIRFDDLESLAGRIGLRLARSWAVEEAAADKPARLATAWGRVNLWHEFLDSTATTEVSSATGFIPFSAALEQDWFEAGIGGSLQLTASTTVYGNVNFETSFDGDHYGVGGKIGLRMNW